MNAESSPGEAPQTTAESQRSESNPSSLQAEQHGDTEASESKDNQDYPSEEADRHLEAIGRWLADKAKDASLIDIVGIVTGIVLVIVGVIAAFIYDGQLAEMRHTNELTDRALAEARSNNVQQQARDEKTLQSSIDNFQRDQRPWVMVKFMQISPIKQDKGGSISGQVLLTNAGRSPAFDVHVTNAGIQMNEGRLDIDVWVRRHQKSTFLGRHTTLAIMAPTDIDTVDYDQTDITQAVLDDIQSGKLWVYTFGDIHYVDSFGYPHFTQYCGLYNRKTTNVVFCPEHIYADRDK